VIDQRKQQTKSQTIHSAEIFANTAQVNLPLVLKLDVRFPNIS